MTDLLNVDQALEQVLAHITLLPAEKVSLFESLNRTLAEDVTADSDIPPFPNSSMDGFAVHAADTTLAAQDTPQQLTVSMDIPAGAAPQRTLERGEAARIMTGAQMPDGADAVIPVENTDAQWKPGGEINLPAPVKIYRSVKSGDYVRSAGEDIHAGQIVLTAGTNIRAQEIGVLASIGCATVPITRQPRVAILSSGDELVDVDQPLAPGKIHDSNSYMLAALVATYGGIPIRIPAARDTLEDVRRRFREALDLQPDIILSSAGVSVGAFDVVRAVIDELGQVNFWRINLRPGKPLAFGSLGGKPFFGLPGNPVSAMVTFDVFVRPALLKLRGSVDHTPTIQAVLTEDLRSDGRRSYLRVKLARENGNWVARMTGTQSSGALTSMVLADGLLIVPEDVLHVQAGQKLPVRLLRNLD
ncbi:MAG: molybdopterin molybdotransferase MoeA [Anaerolineae bacterium]|nr:molybdopterin molybdotransferase MoeA [Anaerolineae bacterium]